MEPLPAGLARALEREIARWVPPLTGVDAADYRQEALLAWWQAAQRYDPTRDATLATYGAYRLLGRVKDVRTGTTHAGHLHYWPLERRWGARRRVRRRRSPLEGRLLQGEREIWIRQHVNRLRPRWRYVIIRVYWSAWPQARIARHLGVTQARVSQMHARTLQALRQTLTAEARARWSM